jgi:pimeloyl-ACP methyl ester carboxylesterase
VFARRADVSRFKAGDITAAADDPLAGHLDLSRLAAIGHSFGGSAALQWCRDDPRCRVAVNLDGALWTEVGRLGLDRPVLQLLAPHREFAVEPEEAVTSGMAPDTGWFLAEREITLGGWRTVQRLSPTAYSYQVEGATHLSFMDVPFLPLGPDSPVGPMLAATAIAPDRMWRIVGDTLLAFLGTHLGGGLRPGLDEVTAGVAELRQGPP